MLKALNKNFGWLFLCLFFCSGTTALVYEVVWSKYLSQMFGSTIQAQTVVLAVFMGGLALGNYIFGKKADRLRTPVRTYGFLEGAIGVYAFFFSFIYSGADQLFVSVGSRIFGNSIALLALKIALSVALLLGPTVLMGGTLPLLAAWLHKTFADSGRSSALFYGINSLGAVAGSGLAGFYLVETWGMIASLQLTALLNLAIGATAFLLGKKPMEAAPAEVIGSFGQTTAQSTLVLRTAALVAAITGGVSMGLEVLASRSLALIFGSSLQSFAIVLMAFILGIGLGSSAIASARLQRWSTERLIAILLLGAAAWIGVLVSHIEGWVEFYRVARTGIARSSVGYTYNQWLSAIMAITILGVPAALIGSVLPLLIRTVARESAALGEQVGKLLTSNTVGAVSGVLLTGFLIMPSAGVRNAFIILALGLCSISFFIAWRDQWRLSLVFPACIGAGLVATMAFGGEDWRHVISSGVFRARETELDKELMTWRKKNIKILYYKDAPDATVSVEEHLVAGVTNLRLRINGKPDASTHGDLCTQMLLGHLPIFARPESQDVFLLGMGSGISASAVLAHPVKQLVVAENCKPVIRAAEFFGPWNRNVLKNPKLDVRHEDARTVLRLSPQKYDVIISEPSNPWTAGIGSVFSLEFYEMAANRLKAGGIMSQWFHIYEMHDNIVALVLRTFSKVFPYVEIWDCNDGDIVILGALQPWASSPEAYEAGITRKQAFEDLKRVGINSPAALFARQLASQQTAFAIPGEGAIQQDWIPVLEYQAPKAFFIGARARMLSQFDERTWQLQNAPAWKRAILQTLSNEDLKSVFLEHSSINDDIVVFVRDRLNAPRAFSDSKRIMDYRDAPLIFRQTDSITQAIAVAAMDEKLPADERQLLAARNILETDSGSKKRAVDEIERLLARRTPESQWPASAYAALAIKATLSEGNIAKAKDLLQGALKLKADDTELKYLGRLIEREETQAVRKLSTAK